MAAAEARTAARVLIVVNFIFWDRGCWLSDLLAGGACGLYTANTISALATEYTQSITSPGRIPNWGETPP